MKIPEEDVHKMPCIIIEDLGKQSTLNEFDRQRRKSTGKNFDPSPERNLTDRHQHLRGYFYRGCIHLRKTLSSLMSDIASLSKLFTFL